MTDEPEHDDLLPEGERIEGKRDRLARLLSVLRVLHAHGDAGISPGEIARRTGMSKRSIYRDLNALQTEMQIPLWSDRGKWGVQPGAFLPPLRLTLPEAMAVFLSARLVTRYADKYEPNLASAFEKIGEGLPDALREHVVRTLDDLALRRIDPDFNRHVEVLTKAWAERRVVRFRYHPARYDGADREARWAEVEPYLLEPSLATHALYLIGWDRTRDGDPDVQGGADRRPVAHARDLRRARGGGRSRRPCDARGTSSRTSPRRRSCCASRRPSRRACGEATWHPSQVVAELPDGSLEWRARVAGTIEIRLWILSWGDEVEVLEPAALRADVAATLARAAARYADG